MIIEIVDKYCFIRSILASLHPCENNHPIRVSSYRQYFNEINPEGLDFRNGFNCSDVHKIQKLNIFSINIFELSFYQDQNRWKHKLHHFEINKNESERVIDL